jgi:hypothetical protein
MRITNSTRQTQRSMSACALLALLAVMTVGQNPGAQSFVTGSDGSDGALTVAASQGTIVFDPKEQTRWGKELDADGDGVYNFTTITIGVGSTLRLQGDRVNRPLYWLASGDVVINGTLDLSGAAGIVTSDLSLRRQVSIPGSGGYAGGAGGIRNSSPTATSGEGPGGGSGGVPCSGNGYVCGKGGTFSGNRYLLPLIGGSGGEGGTDDRYVNGGGGGGAILIASSTSITVGGAVTAIGGNGIQWNISSGGGSGGAIRLVAPTLYGGGKLNVNGGSSGGGQGGAIIGGSGLVRLEAFTGGNSFVLTAGGAFVTRGSPVDPTSLRPASSIRVTAIDGVQVLPSPSGSFVLPDVTISKNGPVNVEIQATGIPNGTVVTLQVYPQSPTDGTIVNLPTAQATLNGNLQLSTATATFTFPYGFSRGFVRASWTQ